MDLRFGTTVAERRPLVRIHYKERIANMIFNEKELTLGDKKILLRSATPEDALTLREIEACHGSGALDEKIRSIDSFFMDAPAASVPPELDLRAHNGNAFVPEELVLTGRPLKLRLYDSAGAFLGLYAWDPRRAQYHPEKMFLPL